MVYSPACGEAVPIIVNHDLGLHFRAAYHPAKQVSVDAGLGRNLLLHRDIFLSVVVLIVENLPKAS